MIIQNRTISVALTYTQRQTSKKSSQNLHITNSIEVTIVRVARSGGPREPGSPNRNTTKDKNVTISLVSSVSVSLNIFAHNSTRVQH